MADDIKLDLDPKKILGHMKDIQDGVKQLSELVEKSLGKDAPKSIGKLEEATEKGTGKIASYFRDLGTRIKEDLKTAFAATEILGGMKFAETLGKGVKQVFEMERAFDRLNTRLGLTGKQMNDFKKALGQSVAGTGQKLEEVLPGVESAAAKGGVKSPQQLTLIGEALGRAKAVTGEETGGLADTIVEILKHQGKAITAESFKSALDALESTRVSGAFKTAGEAGMAVESITQGVSAKQLKQMGLGVRELGGLAAAASGAGEQGQEILRHILTMATQAGGKQQLNAIFGANLFKNGKLDVSAFTRINKDRFGQYSEQALSAATGADQAGLSRFLDVMKGSQNSFKTVISGQNETAAQFKTATDNFASAIDQFKEHSKEAGREVGEAFIQMDKNIFSHVKGKDLKKITGDLKDFGKTIWENKGTLAADIIGGAAVGTLAGGGAKALLGKIGGGLPIGGIVGAAAAKAAGIQQVYVVNAAEIGSAAGSGGGLLGTAKGAAKSVGVITAGLAVGYGIHKGAEALGIEKYYTFDKAISKLYDILHPNEIKASIANGVVEGHRNRPVQLTNPSSIHGQGSGM